jgi:hypothetical protein
MTGSLLAAGAPSEERDDEAGGSRDEQDERQGELDEGDAVAASDRIEAHLTETDAAGEQRESEDDGSHHIFPI